MRTRGSSSSSSSSSCVSVLPLLTLGLLVSVLLLWTEVSVVVAEDTAEMMTKAERGSDEAEDGDADSNATSTRSNEDSFADMIDRALEKEFTENEQNEAADSGSFNNSVAGQQAVLETVARVRTKKNETKEDKSFQLHTVFNLDSENRAEDTQMLIDRKVSTRFYVWAVMYEYLCKGKNMHPVDTPMCWRLHGIGLIGRGCIEIASTLVLYLNSR